MATAFGLKGLPGRVPTQRQGAFVSAANYAVRKHGIQLPEDV